MEHHQRNTAGNGKIVAYMTDHFRLPKDFASLVYVTQALQAECVRTGVEYWRRNRHRTSGALYWQLNDCWPVASWSSLDYFGRWKALHYVARRFYAPVLLSAEEEGATVSLHVTNDLTSEWRGTVRWSLETLAGEVLAAGEKSITVPALSAEQACTLDFSGQIDVHNRRQVVLVYELWQDDGCTHPQRTSLGVVPFAPSKHLALTDPELHYTVAERDTGFEIEVTAQKLARFVWLELEGADPIFGDNFFDLPAGRTMKVTLPKIKGWNLDRVRETLRVRSLVDSF